MSGLKCDQNCKLEEHGKGIVSIATKGTDSQVLNLWVNLCKNWARVRCNKGKCSIHAAAESGRSKLVHWLLKKKGLNVNVRSSVTGETALHLSISNAHLNVVKILLQFGANPTIIDNDGKSSIDLLIERRREFYINEVLEENPALLFPPWKDLSGYSYEAHVWGTNKTLSIGTGKEGASNVPEQLDTLPTMTETGHVVLQRYHSLFLIGENKGVYAAGTGVRLGLNSMSAVTPTPVKFSRSSITCVAEHNLFPKTSKGFSIF